MCSIEWHTCPTCGEEYRCRQSNNECPEFNGFQGEPCGKCDNWDAAMQREDDRVAWERKRFEEEYGWEEDE